MITLRWTALAAVAAVILAASGPSYASNGPPKKPGKCAVAGEIGAKSGGDAGALAAGLAGLLVAACVVGRRRR